MINFEIGFSVNSKSLTSQLKTINQEITQALSFDNKSSGGLSKELSEAVISARTLENVLSKATTTKGLSFVQMNAELRKAGITADQLITNLAKGGQNFSGSLNEALISFSSANREAIKLNDTLKEAGRVFTQSLKFNIANQAINSFQDNIRETIEWVIDLNDQLTQIQIVSGKSSSAMEQVSASILANARDLKVAASDYAQASQIYYQQGLSDAEVERRANITIKAAQAANESTSNMADMLTAIWNTYQMQGDQLENAASVAAKLGAETAIEFRDIAEAMQISATAASTMGISYNSLASIIATVGSTTRQSASIIGNAYKTIFNNFERLKVDGENGEVTLKAASQQLQALGIQLLDSNGQIKELDEVIMQAGTSWNSYTQNQKVAIAQIVGGTRQFGQFLALMENFDYYLENLASADSEFGAQTLENQYEIAINSIDNKIINATEKWRQAFAQLFPEETLGDVIDSFGEIGNIISDVIDGLGGLDTILNLIGVYAFSQLPKGFQMVKGYVTDIIDSSNPNAQMNRIQKDFNKMRSNVNREVSLGNISKEEAAIQQKKINISEKAAKAQANLNKVIANGTAIEKTNAENLQKNISARQELLIKMQDEIAATEKAAQSKDNYYKKLSLEEQKLQALTQAQQQYQQSLFNRKGNKGATGTLSSDYLYSRLQSRPQDRDIIPETSYTGNKQTDVSMLLNSSKAFRQNANQALKEGNFQNAAITGKNISTLENYEKQLKNLKISIEDFLVHYDSLTKTISKDLKPKSLEELEKILPELDSEAKGAAESLNDLIKVGQKDLKTDEEIQDLRIALENCKNAFQDNQDLALSFSSVLDSLDSGDLNRINELLDNLGDELLEAANNAQVLDNKLSTTANNAGNALKRGASYRKGTQDLDADINAAGGLSESFEADANSVLTSGTQVLAEAYFTGQMIQNAKEVLTDAESSGTEIVTSLGGVAGAFVETHSTMSTFLKGAAQIGPQLTRAAASMTKFGGVASKLGGILTKLGGLTGPAGWALTAGLTAATMILPKIVDGIHDWIYAEEIAREEAIKRAEESSAAYTDVKESYENLLSELENYQAAEDALAKLTYGTREWENAVASLNSQVLELLQLFPELSQYISNNNGKLEISAEGLKELPELYARKEREVYITAQLDARQVSNDEFEQNLDTNAEKITYEKLTQFITKNGERVPQFNEVEISSDVLETVVKHIVDNNDMAILTDWERLRELLGLEEVSTNNNEYDTRENTTRTNIIQALTSNTDIISTLVSEYKANTLSQRNLTDVIGDNTAAILLEDNEKYLDSGLSNYVSDKVSEFLETEDPDNPYTEEEITDKANSAAAKYKNDVEKVLNAIPENISVEEREIIAEMMGGVTNFSHVSRSLFNTATKHLNQALVQTGLSNTYSTKEASDIYNRERQQVIDNHSDLLRDSQFRVMNDENNPYVEFEKNIQDITNEQFKALYDGMERYVGEAYAQAKEKADEMGLSEEEKITFLKDEVDKATTQAMNIVNDSGLEYFLSLMGQLPASFEQASAGIRTLMNTIDEVVDSRMADTSTYENLLGSLGPSLMKEFFTYAGDGMYALTGDAETFYRIVKAQNQANLQAGIEAESNKLAAMQDVSTNYSEYEVLTGEKETAFSDTFLNQRRLKYIDAFGDSSSVDANLRNKILAEETLSANELQLILDLTKQAGDQTKNLVGNIEAQTDKLNEARETASLMNTLMEGTQAGISEDRILDYADTIQYVSQTEQEGIDINHQYADSLSEVDAAELAKEQLRFNEGLRSSTENYEDWLAVLKEGPEAGEEYTVALGEIDEAYSNILDIDEGLLSPEFLGDPENLEKINDLLYGTDEVAMQAYDDLSKLAFIDIGESLGLDQIEGVDLAGLASGIQSALDGVSLGGFVNLDEQWADQMDAILAETGGDVTAINALLSAIGMEPLTEEDLIKIPEETTIAGTEVEDDTSALETEATQKITGYKAESTGRLSMPIMATSTDIGNSEDGTPMFQGGLLGNITVPSWTYTPQTLEDTATSETNVPAYTVKLKRNSEGGFTGKKAGGQGKIVHAASPTTDTARGGSPRPTGGGGGGGGGKKSTYKKPTPKVRYTNRNNQISRTQKTAEKLSQVEDQLYGKAKLAAMQKKSDLLVQQVKDYKALYDEAVAYREQDMQDLAATQLGQAVPMQIDAEGNILNQEEMDDYMREWKDRIDAIEDEGAKEAEQRAYDVSEQAYTYYKEAQEKALEAMKEAVSQLGEWIQNEIEKRQYQMEIDIKVSDRQLSLLEFTLEELGSAGWITDWENGLDNVINQVYTIMDAGESTIDSTESLIELFDKVNNGGLDWSQLDQDMKDMFPKDVWEEANANGTLTNDILEAIGDNTETLLDYAGQLTEAWVSAWEKIGEAMDSYLEQLERARSPLETQAEVLETFISVADQVGWDVDKIDKYNELLDKQTDILEANYEASVKQAAATQDALDAMEPVYQDYLERFENGEITGQQFDVIQEQYYNLVDANQDAISQMTSDWSAYVENLQEKFEIAQQQIIKTWNDGIGNMWNDLAESQEGFDLFESLRTWYLDDFNKDYGLTTLTNQIEDAMNSISDPSRLKEYDAFMAEIVAKQEEGYELSQGELDVLNARFQLMQAQDAYEEAKNNKNTMRLTRDASGNYSYVYSSDSTENQEQAVLDAQKALHDAEEQYLSESESRWYEWMLKKYDLVVNTDWELYAHDEEYRRQFQLQWDQLTQAMQNATNDVNNALTYTDRTYEETAIHHMTNTESMNQANAQYNEQFQILWDEIQAKYEETDQKVQESASLIIDSNLSLEDAANDLMGTIDDTMGNMMDTTDELADNMSSNMQTMIEDTASWSDSIIEDINAIIAKYKELYEAQTNVMQNHTGETRNYTWNKSQDGTKWWYGDINDPNNKYMRSGWELIDGKWYFFNDEGYMESGVDINGDGKLWVDNGHYQVDSSGAWIEGTIAEGHTPGDWQDAVDNWNWGANYGDLASGNWSNTNSGGQLSSRPSSGSSSSSGPISGSSEENSYDMSHAGDEDAAHWLRGDGGKWYYGTYDPSGEGNQGAYYDGYKIINGRLYWFDEDGYLAGAEDGYALDSGRAKDFMENGMEAVWEYYSKGGYTGNKGIRGVDSIPAMLAPGEYVLNHDDTTKILSAVQLLRGLSSGALTTAANAIAKLANGSIPQTTQSERIPVQQDVHIEATFPNVSVASEIEDALNNLVNETVQLIGAQNTRRI